MNRTIVQVGAIPQDSDILNINRNAMIALGYLAQATIGTGTVVDGLACAPTSPASMQVNVGPGSIFSLETVDTTAYGSLPSDNDPLVQIGINWQGETAFTLTAPTTSGDSQNYLIEATWETEDTDPVVLPFYNAANPSQPYSGPGNTGVAQNTQRNQIVELQTKAGAAAPTGTQTTPAVDSGYVGLWVVTVAYGQVSITSSSIAAYPGAPFLPAKLPSIAWGSALWPDTGSANAAAITINPAPASMAALVGVPLRVKKTGSANTGAFTVNVNGLGATNVVLPGGATPLANIALGSGIFSVVYDGTNFEILGTQPPNQSLASGQCVLEYTSATELTLLPSNGCNVLIAGQQYQIPSGGVTVSNAGLADSTLYYVYLLYSGGTLGLQCSTTGHVTDTTAGNVGVEIMSGNNAHSLVGMAYTSSSGQFGGTFLTRSWFNRGSFSAVTASVDNSTASSTPISIGPSASALAWAGEGVSATASGTAYNSTAGYGAGMLLAVDGNMSSSTQALMTSVTANATATVTSVTGITLSSDAVVTFDCYGQTADGFSSGGNAFFNLGIEYRVG